MGTIFRRAFLGALALLLSTFWPSSGWAQWKESFERGREALIQGRKADAAREYKRATQLGAEEMGFDWNGVADLARRVAEIERDLGNLAEAEKWLEYAMRSATASQAHDHLANAINDLGIVANMQGQYSKSADYFSKAAAAFERLKDERSVAMSLGNLAGVQMRLGQDDQAMANFSRSLKITRAVKEPVREAAVLYALGGFHRERGRLPQAAEALERSVAILEQHAPNTVNHAHSLGNLALFRQQMGDQAGALELSAKGLNILEQKLGAKHVSVGDACQNIGFHLSKMKRWAEAEAYFRRAMEIHLASAGPDSALVAWDLNNLGDVQLRFGRHEQAKEHFNQGIALLEKVFGPDHPEVITALKGRADVMNATGQSKDAVKIYERIVEARVKRQGEGHIETIYALTDLGLALFDLKEYDKLDPLYERIRAAIEKHLPADHPAAASHQLHLSNLRLYQRRFEESIQYGEKALELYRAREGEDGHGTTLSRVNLSLSLRRLGKWEEAAAHCDRSRRGVRNTVTRMLPVLSEPEQLAFLTADYQRDLHSAISLGWARPEDPQMAARSAEWLINGKGVTQEVLTQTALSARDIADPAALADLRELSAVRRQLSSLSKSSAGDQRKRVKELVEREEGLAKRVARATRRDVGADPWVTLEQVRKQIPKDSALVEFCALWPWDKETLRLYHLPGRYVAWIIPPAGEGDVRLVDLGEWKPIDEGIVRVRKSIASSQASILEDGEAEAEAALKKELAGLSKLILAPLEKHLANRKHWILCPDTDLWLVPWGALVLGDGSYLTEKHVPSFVVSSRDLAGNVPREASGNPGFVLADPDFDRVGADPAGKIAGNGQRGQSRSPGRALEGGWQRLPGTAEECKKIAPKVAAFSKQEPTMFTGQDAREEAFLDVYQPRLVVLATHGFFLEPPDAKPDKPEVSPENPLLRCGLALAGANRKGPVPAGAADGVLTGLEIIGVDLRGTELVVLSACETGIGDLNAGEGVAGLRQAFQLAGAQSVVSTLWKIPDQETALLMQSFWDNLAAGEDKATALAKAQRALIHARRSQGEKVAHPLFWAAFTMTGAWQPAPVGAARQRPARPGPQVVVVAASAEIMNGKELLARVGEGDRLTMIERRGEWVLVRVPGSERQGWILARHVEPVE